MLLILSVAEEIHWTGFTEGLSFRCAQSSAVKVLMRWRVREDERRKWIVFGTAHWIWENVSRPVKTRHGVRRGMLLCSHSAFTNVVRNVVAKKIIPVDEESHVNGGWDTDAY